MTTVRPTPGEKIRRRIFVAGHPNFGGDSVYADVDRWVGNVASIRAGGIRGMASANLSTVKRTAELAELHHLDWIASVATEGTSEAELRRNLDFVREHAALFRAVEGVNEPDKDGLKDAEAAWCVKSQQIIWDSLTTWPETQHIRVLSPALQVKATEAEVAKLAGIAGHVHAVSRHQYNAADPQHVQEFLAFQALTAKHWGVANAWITETGWTNATQSHDIRRLSEQAAAHYAVPMFLSYLQAGAKAVAYYEAMDDSSSLTNNEARFGMWRPDGTRKPIVRPLAHFLALVWDDNPDFRPAKLDVGVVQDPANDGEVVNWHVTQTTNAPPLIHLWRPNARVWDPVKGLDIDIEPVPVNVNGGHHLIGAGVTSVTL